MLSAKIVRRFRVKWAHQDSNLEPRDSRDPGISARRGLSLRPQLAL